MTRNEFHKGWAIMIFDGGIAGKSPRYMMAVKGGETLDFPGVVINDEQALNYAKRKIDSIERNVGFTDFTEGEKQKI
jgi:hypothetical protein